MGNNPLPGASLTPAPLAGAGWGEGDRPAHPNPPPQGGREQQGLVPFARPFYGPEEEALVARVIRSGWVSQGEQVERFERRVATFAGAAEAVATNAATTALILALRTQGVGPGDDVICPSFTCMATANAIIALHARPVFVDIDPRTYNLDVAHVAAAVTPRTRAILGVDQIGLPADWNALADLARRYGVALVEDAACALGAEYHGRRVGGLGWPTVFSFHPRKIVSTGEGGMVLFADAAHAERARRLRSHGAAISDRVRHQSGGSVDTDYPEPGYNFRLTDLQGALGAVQMERLEWLLAERRRQARLYDEALGGLEPLETPWTPPGCRPAYQSYLLRLRPACRWRPAELVRQLVAHGIACRTGIEPLHLGPYFRQRQPGLHLPQSERAARTTLFLPIFPGLTEAQQTYVIETLTRLVRTTPDSAAA